MWSTYLNMFGFSINKDSSTTESSRRNTDSDLQAKDGEWENEHVQDLNPKVLCFLKLWYCDFFIITNSNFTENGRYRRLRKISIYWLSWFLKVPTEIHKEINKIEMYLSAVFAQIMVRTVTRLAD